MTITKGDINVTTEEGVISDNNDPILGINILSAEDLIPPFITGRSPGPGNIDILLDSKIELSIVDQNSGLDEESVTIYVNNIKAYENQSVLNGFSISKSELTFGFSYEITYPSYLPDHYDVDVRVLAEDNVGNSVDESWTFTTIDAPFITTVPSDPNNRYMLDTPMIWKITTYSTNVVIDSIVINTYEVVSNNVINSEYISSGSINHTANETTISLISERPVPWRDVGVVTMNWTIQYHDDDNPGIVEDTGSFSSVGSVYYLKVWRDPVVDDIFVIRDNEFQALVYDPREPDWDGYLLAESGDPDGYWQGTIVGNGTGGLDITIDSTHNYFPGEYFNWEMFYQEVDGVDAYRSGEVYNPPDGVYYTPTTQHSGLNMKFDTNDVDSSTSTGGGPSGLDGFWISSVEMETSDGQKYTTTFNGTTQPGWEGSFTYDEDEGKVEFFMKFVESVFDFGPTEDIVWRIIFTLGNQIYYEQQTEVFVAPGVPEGEFSSSKEAFFEGKDIPEPDPPRVFYINPDVNEMVEYTLGTATISLTGQGNVVENTVNISFNQMPAVVDGYFQYPFTGNIFDIDEYVDGYDEYGFDFIIDTSQIPFDPYTTIQVTISASDAYNESVNYTYDFNIRDIETPRIIDFNDTLEVNKYGHIIFNTKDVQSGVDLDSSIITIDGQTIYENGSFSSRFSGSSITSTADGYRFYLISNQEYPSASQIAVSIASKDFHGNG